MGGRRILISLIAAGTVLGCSETIETYYPTLLEAKRAGAVEKGWIPPGLPSSSRDIHERHDLDSNRGWIKFTYDKEQGRVFLRELDGIPDAKLDSITLRPPKVTWWHSAIREGSLHTARRSQGFEIYHKRLFGKNEYGMEFTEDWFFAIKASEGLAYAWVASAVSYSGERGGELPHKD